MALKLYTNPENPLAYKILVTAKYAGVNIELAPYTHGESNKTPEFLAKNPLGKVPVLDTPEGPVFESNAIVRFVARHQNPNQVGVPSLYGNGVYESGLVDQWIDFAVSEIELPASAWLYPIYGLIPNNPTATQKAKNDIRKVLGILDQYLLTRTFLVGNNVTIADIAVASALLNLYKLVLDPGFRKTFVNTNRWFNTTVNQPEFKEVVGEVKLAERMAAAAAPAERERPERPAAEEKPKKAEKEQKPKEEKPKKAEKPKKEEDDDAGEEDYEDKEDKRPDPFANLPKSNFIMDEWKRMYSNNDTRSVALPWFFENYDPAGYCVFFCEYKYNNELEKVFMTSNLIGGMFQRLEKLHKYGFGSMIIFGDEPHLSISGVWLFRGSDVPDIMKECDDFPNYEWRRGDFNNDADKKLFQDYLAWDGELGGKKFNAGKVYK